jgi:hypothetical protein
VNPVILIGSCARDRENGFNRAARETWLRTWSELVPYKFVLGRGCQEPLPDEIVLDVDDGYLGTPYKFRESHRWATEQGYDFTFHCDSDTYVIVPRLLSSGFQEHECIGYMISNPEMYPQGGAGYWLGPRGNAAVILDSPQPEEKWGDLWLGNALRRSGVHDLTHDTRYWPCDAPHALTNPLFTECRGIPEESQSVISVHLGVDTGVYNPERMRALHAAVCSNFRGSL